jgi:hypothetical protein
VSTIYAVTAAMTRMLDLLLRAGAHANGRPGTATPRPATRLLFEPVCQQETIRALSQHERQPRRAS